MDRRKFFVGAAALGLASVATPKLAKADDEENEIVVSSEISRNHGHGLEMTPGEVIKNLRATNENGPVTIDIQGQSGHPHAITLTNFMLQTLLTTGEISVVSTTDANHSHDVVIRLDV